MEFMAGNIKTDLKVKDLVGMSNTVVHINGVVHKIREMSDFAFVILRTNRDVVQCVCSKEYSKFDLNNIKTN